MTPTAAPCPPPPRRRLRPLLTLAAGAGAAGLLVLLGSGCQKAAPAAGAAPSQPPSPVTVAAPLEKEVVDWNEFIGRTDAVESVDVRARVTGYLEQVAFKAGTIVNKGDLLFVIDPRPYQADLDRANAVLEQARAQLRLATAEFNRAKDLRAKNVISADDFDNRVSAFQQNEASARSAEAQVETARLNLEFCSIRSPIAGRVSRENVTVGNLIQANDSSANGVLTSVVSVDPIYAYFDVDENAVLNYMKLSEEGKLKTARETRVPVYLALQNEEGYPHEGYCDFVENKLQAGTGTIRARGVFKTWDALLTPGFFVRVRTAASPPYQALLIPDQAVGSDQDQKFVFVVDPQKRVAEYRSVRLGPISDGLRVVKEGLKPGEMIITNGLLRVRPNAPVDPRVEKLALPTGKTQA